MGMSAECDRLEFHAAVTTLLDACSKYGKAPGFLATTVEMARA